MSRTLALLLCVLLLASAPPAAGWSEAGHRLVAELAEQRLDPATRSAALALLAASTSVPQPVASLAEVAGWADQVRDRSEYEWSRPLHFVNLSDDCRYEPARHCERNGCIVAAIDRFAARLADRSLSRPERAEALQWLVHLIGDIHQPLHSGSAADLGGNRYQVQLAGEGTNLHSVWDRHLLAVRGLAVDEHRRLLGSEPLPRPGPLAPARWAEASCELIASAALYPSGHKLDQRYLQQHLPLAERQVRLAAARLAAVIEQALGAHGE